GIGARGRLRVFDPVFEELATESLIPVLPYRCSLPPVGGGFHASAGGDSKVLHVSRLVLDRRRTELVITFQDEWLPLCDLWILRIFAAPFAGGVGHRTGPRCAGIVLFTPVNDGLGGGAADGQSGIDI